jgi:hypothetical protein
MYISPIGILIRSTRRYSTCIPSYSSPGCYARPRLSLQARRARHMNRVHKLGLRYSWRAKQYAELGLPGSAYFYARLSAHYARVWARYVDSLEANFSNTEA